MGFTSGKLVTVRLRAAVGSAEQVNTFHYDLDDSLAGPDNDPQSLADAFRDDVVPAYKALFHESWFIQPVVVYQEKDPLNPTAARSEWTSGSPVAGLGTDTSNFLPQGSCTIVHLSTAHIGRRFSGRLFIGGNPTEAHQSNGQWGSGWLALVDAFMDAIPRQPDIAEGASSAVANWGVYSRTQRAASLDPYISPITAVTIRDRVRWLRSRQQ